MTGAIVETPEAREVFGQLFLDLYRVPDPSCHSNA